MRDEFDHLVDQVEEQHERFLVDLQSEANDQELWYSSREHLWQWMLKKLREAATASHMEVR